MPVTRAMRACHASSAAAVSATPVAPPGAAADSAGAAAVGSADAAGDEDSTSSASSCLETDAGGLWQFVPFAVGAVIAPAFGVRTRASNPANCACPEAGSVEGAGPGFPPGPAGSGDATPFGVAGARPDEGAPMNKFGPSAFTVPPPDA